MKTCQQCNVIYSEDTSFCKSCGSPLTKISGADMEFLKKKIYCAELNKYGISKIFEYVLILIMIILSVFTFAFILRNFGYYYSNFLTTPGGVKINDFTLGVPIVWSIYSLVICMIVMNFLRIYFKINKSKKKKYIEDFISSKGEKMTVSYSDNLSLDLTKKIRYNFIFWLILIGFFIMFSITSIFLSWFQTEEIFPIWYPQRLLGYFAAFIMLLGIFLVLFYEFDKNSKFKLFNLFNFPFLILLLLTIVSGIITHICRMNILPYYTYIFYIMHISFLIPLLLIEVPFSISSILFIYRPILSLLKRA